MHDDHNDDVDDGGGRNEMDSVVMWINIWTKSVQQVRNSDPTKERIEERVHVEMYVLATNIHVLYKYRDIFSIFVNFVQALLFSSRPE